MKQWIKKHKVWFIFGIIILVIYIIFGVTRYSEHTTFILFTGRVLNIDAKNLYFISIQSGNTGERVLYTEGDDVREMCDQLNGFRYIAWLPKNPFPAGGWTYRVVLDFKDGAAESYYFGGNWIEARGVRYFSAGKYFDEWTRQLDEK